jgi:hypothetical protein
MSGVLYIAGPEELGGYGDLAAKLDAAVKATGKTVAEIGDTVYGKAEGKVVKIPGVPDMYDYEYFPQEVHLSLQLLGMSTNKYTRISSRSHRL